MENPDLTTNSPFFSYLELWKYDFLDFSQKFYSIKKKIAASFSVFFFLSTDFLQI